LGDIMKKLILGMLLVFCLTSFSWAQNKGRPQGNGQKPPQNQPSPPMKQPPMKQPPMKQPPMKQPPMKQPQPYHHQPYQQPYHHQDRIYLYSYPEFYPYYVPYYIPYYIPQNNDNNNEEPVDEELYLKIRPGWVLNPKTDKLEWRSPGYWKQDKDKWLYKRTKEWPQPGHWINKNGKRIWQREDLEEDEV
jgi:hypothetical protein